MKKCILVSALFFLIAAACTLGDGKISVSENTFQMNPSGGEITFTTSGFVKCVFRVSDNPLYTGNLRLNQDGVTVYSAEWFFASIDKEGTRVRIVLQENVSGEARTLSIHLDNLDMHETVSIHQKHRI